MKKSVQFSSLDGSSLTIGIVKARWNSEYTDALSEQCLQALADAGVARERIILITVPGSFELVYGAKRLIETRAPDAVICVGALVKGETAHFDYLAGAVSQGIMRLNAEGSTPVIFGVLTCLNSAQAHERSLGSKSSAYDWGLSAVEMGLLRKTL